jgi:hypothetical protein
VEKATQEGLSTLGESLAGRKYAFVDDAPSALPRSHVAQVKQVEEWLRHVMNS